MASPTADRVLDYAVGGRPAQQRVSRSGVASLVCLLAVPALGIITTPIVLFVLGPSPMAASIVMLTVLGLPFCGAVAFGCHSVATAGIALRNLSGVIGCAVSLTCLAFVLIAAVLDRLP